MLPRRTSPTAKTPGRVVSSRYGDRARRPTRRGQVLRRQVRTGLDESAPVECHAAIEPPCTRHRARHHEHVSDVMCFDGVRTTIAPLDAIEVLCAVQRDQLCPKPCDRRMLLDATNQVARHRIGQPRFPDQQVGGRAWLSAQETPRPDPRRCRHRRPRPPRPRTAATPCARRRSRRPRLRTATRLRPRASGIVLPTR